MSCGRFRFDRAVLEKNAREFLFTSGAPLQATEENIQTVNPLILHITIPQKTIDPVQTTPPLTYQQSLV
jgi:hypothetical protein